jgi:MoxR-like ATPase
MSNWQLYDPKGQQSDTPVVLPPAPPWRRPGSGREAVLAATFQPRAELVDAVNTALYLRRPLLITGKPGTGKSSLVHSVARNLGLGKVIEWPVNSRSTLPEGLYQYDALGRLHHIQQSNARSAMDRPGIPDADEADELGQYLTLGPLGTALASARTPRALLVDEVDKSDIDLPNDLLNVLDTGRFVIPELKRVASRHPIVKVASRDGEKIVIHGGEVTFTEFPFMVMTSNGERDFPAAFLRRCVQCQIQEPSRDELVEIVTAHFQGAELGPDEERIVKDFVTHRGSLQMATDQLLNAVHMLHQTGSADFDRQRARLQTTLFQKLG